jgi:Flp pilus assembly protein TadD
VREQEPEKIKAPNPFEHRAQPELIPPPQLLEQPRVMPPEPAKPRPMEDPREASARHVALGKEVFAIGEYGRAAFRFQKAAELGPDQALPHFLLAQSLLALGKYRDAVAAIHAGMALDPTWPATGARFAVLYGPANIEFALHFEQLAAARTAHPDDPVLLFLQGVTLWFDGRQDDARPLFEKAAPRVPDRRDIDRFLQK